MSSDKQTAANRRNGRRSRGPTTTAGKTRSRANALRHGLSATVLTPPDLRDDIEALAKAIAGGDAEVARLAFARQIAAAQLDLMRVQVAKVALMNSQSLVTPPAKEPAAEIAETFQNADPDVLALDLSDETALTQDLVLVPSIDVLNQLARLERYERRAIARYRRAARSFITYQSV